MLAWDLNTPLVLEETKLAVETLEQGVKYAQS